MKSYLKMTREELLTEKNDLEKEFQKIKELSLDLNLTRGKLISWIFPWACTISSALVPYFGPKRAQTAEIMAVWTESTRQSG